MIFLICLALFNVANSEETNLSTVTLQVDTHVTPALYGPNESTDGVIFVHSRGQDHKQWAYLTKYMSSKTQKSISMDRLKFDQLQPEKQHFQVLSAAQFLIDEGATDLSCVGIDFSASLCAQAAAADGRISRVVMISPDWKSNGIALQEVFKPTIRYLALYSEFDSHALRTMELLGEHDNLEEITSGKQAMGPKLLYIHPKMEADMVQWLLKDPPKMESAPRKVIKPLKEDIDIETKGEELPW